MRSLTLALSLMAVALTLGGCHRVKVRDLDGKLVTIKGSYALTCRHVVDAENGMLTAECMDGQQQFHPTSLQPATCKGDIANINGALSCPH
jgi:hypothetical protein